MSESASAPASPTPSAPTTTLAFNFGLDPDSPSPTAANDDPWLDKALNAATTLTSAQSALEAQVLSHLHDPTNCAVSVPRMDPVPQCSSVFVAGTGVRVIRANAACRVNTAVAIGRPNRSSLFRPLRIDERSEIELTSGPDAHVCAPGTCNPRACLFAGIPSNACRILVDHGVCVDKWCPYKHYAIAALSDTRVVTLHLMKVSSGNRAACFSPLWALLPHEQRLEAERAAEAALERRKRASQSHAEGHRRREAAEQRQIEQVERKVVVKETKMSLADRMAANSEKLKKYARPEAGPDAARFKREPDA